MGPVYVDENSVIVFAVLFYVSNKIVGSLVYGGI